MSISSSSMTSPSSASILSSTSSKPSSLRVALAGTFLLFFFQAALALFPRPELDASDSWPLEEARCFDAFFLIFFARLGLTCFLPFWLGGERTAVAVPVHFRPLLVLMVDVIEEEEEEREGEDVIGQDQSVDFWMARGVL